MPSGDTAASVSLLRLGQNSTTAPAMATTTPSNTQRVSFSPSSMAARMAMRKAKAMRKPKAKAARKAKREPKAKAKVKATMKICL